MEYPIVKSYLNSSEIELALLLENPSPCEPSKPNAPVFEETKSGMVGFLALVIFVAVVILISALANADEFDGNLPATIIICFLVIIGSVVYISTKMSNEKSRVNDYNQKLKYYNTAILDYKKAYQEYSHDLLRYNKELERLKDLQYLNSKLIAIAKKRISNAVPPVRINSNYKMGITEEFFRSYLIKWFSPHITQNMSLQTYQAQIGLSNPERYYIPDFIYYNPNSGMCIDIEIDEPYVGTTGAPIHFIGCNDDYRDDFFINNGWIVIRFTEKQTYLFPNECCKLIARTIHSYFPDSIDICLFDDIKELISDKMPTEQEAHELAFKKYRDSYLNTNLAIGLSD